jgi:hypothetical protein
VSKRKFSVTGAFWAEKIKGIQEIRIIKQIDYHTAK